MEVVITMTAVIKNMKYFTDVVDTYPELAEIFPHYKIAEENYGMKLAILVDIYSIDQMDKLARLNHNRLDIRYDPGKTFEYQDPYDFVIMIKDR